MHRYLELPTVSMMRWCSIRGAPLLAVPTILISIPMKNWMGKVTEVWGYSLEKNIEKD